jgi:hypothetical protein
MRTDEELEQMVRRYVIGVYCTSRTLDDILGENYGKAWMLLSLRPCQKMQVMIYEPS